MITERSADVTFTVSGHSTTPGALRPLDRIDVRLLAAVAEEREISRAAAAVGIRAAAALRQLERIDRAAGVALTLRSHHTAGLTIIGRRALEAGRRFFAGVDRAMLRTVCGRAADSTAYPALLAVATADPLVEDVVLDASTGLNLLLAVHHAEPDPAMAMLDSHRVDAVHTWWLTDPRRAASRTLRLHPILVEPLWVALPSGHPAVSKEVVSLAELHDEEWLSEVGPTGEAAVVHIHRAHGLPAPSRVRRAAPSVIRGLLRRGGTVALCSPASAPVSDGSRVLRPLVEAPTRVQGLVVDPAVVPDALASALAERMTRRHLARFAERNSPLLCNPWWARWLREQAAQLGTGDGAPAATDRAVRGVAPEPDVSFFDVEEIDLLRAIARHGSINRAAGPLAISQPALTRRLHRLEGKLGAPLLLRSRRGTTLTAATREFLDDVAALESEFGAAVVPPPDSSVRFGPRLCVPEQGPAEARARAVRRPLS